MAKFKFKSKKQKNKFNFFADKDDILCTQVLKGAHIEFFSNEEMILEGCACIICYQSDYIELRLKKGTISISGNSLSIKDFEKEKIVIKGNINLVEFDVR